MTHEWAGQLCGGLIAVDERLEGDFDAHLAASATLAFRVAYSVLRHREDAEDVAQEALARAYRHLQQLRHRDRFRSWLVRITWRLAIDRQRAERRRLLREADPIETCPSSTVEGAIAQERAAQLWEAIDALPDKLRVVIVLAAIEEHDLAEVARLLRLPIGTVKSRLFVARQRLKDALQWTRTGQ